MKRIWNNYILLVLCVMLGTSCTEEELGNEPGVLGKEEVWVTLNFGHQDFDPIEITTRSTLGEVAESRVSDMYALIFVNDRCVYNKYFGSDADTKKNTQAEVTKATEECWWVQNRTNSTNTNGYTTDDTHGTIRMRTPTMEGGELYLIANANAYTVNISPQLLGAIRTKQDLLDLTAVLNGDVVTRYGYFPMVAEVKGINITSEGITSTSTDDGTKLPAKLIRLDAKVEVNIKAATDETSSYGTGDAAVTVKVKSFIPESWQVMNVPKGSFIIENSKGEDDITGYFNTALHGFESSLPATYNSKATTNHSFSFYMLENRHTATNVTSYHQRDKRKKNADGRYLYPLPKEEGDEKDIWEYAPKDATYLILKGYLAMEPVSSSVDGVTEVGADVTYYIHLGDFAASSSTDVTKLNNFAVERNTHYTYNITVKGVRNIELEVTSNTENQSGATGSIYATQETSMLLDAHYEQFVHVINAADVNAETMTWYVKTPFGEEGSPKLNDGVDQGGVGYTERLNDFDYQWIWFMVNPITAGTYSKTMQWYPGNQFRGVADGAEKRLMDVDEFVKFLRAEKSKYDRGETSAFKSDEMVLTVFVDEFYYEHHPIEGEDSPQDLWKQFVNQPNRLLHLLSASNRSKDNESSITSSIITIRQRSIQTVYNVDRSSTELPTAWGTENVDEFSNLWFFNGNRSSRNDEPTGTYQAYDSVTNGRYNTAGMLNLRGNSSPEWKVFIDYELEHPYLQSGYQGLLYTTLLRNRDNDGNGKLDADELRWYVASLGQLNEIFIGQLGFFNREAWIYTPETTSQYTPSQYVTYSNYHENCVAWRKHIVASTNATVLWGEEGTSTSSYLEEFGWSGTKNNGVYSIRCARNLGMNYADEDEAKAAIQNKMEEPEPLVDYWVGDINGNELTVTIDANSIYYFDLSNVNVKSLRPQPTEGVLEATDEFQDHALPYRMFRTGQMVEVDDLVINDDSYYEALKTNYLDKGVVPTNGTANYRVPNVREAALMRLYCSSNWWNGRTMVSTYYSNGRLGNDYDYQVTGEPKYSWTFGSGYAQMRPSGWGDQAYNTYREVQDWEP